jgi:hypothetical protein
MKTQDNKQRLFEVMQRLDKTFKPPLNENLNEFDDIMIAEANDYDGEVENPFTPEKITSIEPEKEIHFDPNKETVDDIQIPKSEGGKENINFTIVVPREKTYEVDKKIESLYKAAAKFGLPRPIVTKGQPYVKNITIQTGEMGFGDAYTIGVDVFDLTVNAEGMFKFPGDYKLVAVVDNGTGAAYIIDINDIVPEDMLKVCNSCDHCGVNRYRDKNFIIKDGQGKFMRLGSSCVKKFLGINPRKYLSALQFIMNMESEFDDEWGVDLGGYYEKKGINPVVKIIDTNKAISLVHDYIEKEGYTKREWEYPDRGPKYRTNQGNATADKTEPIMLNNEQWDSVPINHEYVKSFIDFVNGLNIVPELNRYDSEGDAVKGVKPGFEEYKEKIKAMANAPKIRVFESAFLASAISFVEKERARLKELEKSKDSQFLGNVGEKIKIPYAILTDHRSGDSEYGVWHLWTFKDNAGNIMKKFGELPEKFKIQKAPEGSQELANNNFKGDVFAFTSDVKKHEPYQGINITQLGRLSKL